MAKRLREDSISSQSLPTTESTESHTPKYAELDDTEVLAKDHLTAGRERKMQCHLPPHKTLTFNIYADYETHYNNSHSNRCKECQKNLPSAHFLDLHISENHDPIVASRRDRGEKTFACFVEGCGKVCLEWKKRRSHLVDKHGFPKNYDFFIVNDGIDGRRSMLRPGIDVHGHRKSSRERRGSSATETTEATLATEESKDEEASSKSASVSRPVSTSGGNSSVDEVTNSMSALQFVPRSVTFGKRKGKSGFAKS